MPLVINALRAILMFTDKSNFKVFCVEGKYFGEISQKYLTSFVNAQNYKHLKYHIV